MFKGRLRWGIILWFFLVVLIGYMDRVNLSMAAPLIMKEFALSPSQLGWVLSGFQLGYIVLQFFGGYVVQKYSARVSLTVIFFIWSAMTAATGMSWGVISIILFRFIFGLAEGPMFPAINHTIAHWSLPNERGRSAALYTSALPLGVVAGILISAYVISLMGWRSVFYIFGVIGIVLALCTWLIVRDTPDEHPWATSAEIKKIKDNYAAHVDGKSKTVSDFMRDPIVWLASLYEFCLGVIYWADMTWLPTYFVMERKVSILKSGYMASVPWAAAFLGMLVLGWCTDNIGRKFKINWLAFTQFAAAPFISYAVITPDVNTSLMCFCISLFFVGAGLSISLGMYWELWDRINSAKAFGFAVAFMSFAGVVAPSMIGYILELTGSFKISYFIFAGLSVTGGVAACFLHIREKKVRELREELTADAKLSVKVAGAAT